MTKGRLVAGRSTSDQTYENQEGRNEKSLRYLPIPSDLDRAPGTGGRANQESDDWDSLGREVDPGEIWQKMMIYRSRRCKLEKERKKKTPLQFLHEKIEYIDYKTYRLRRYY